MRSSSLSARVKSSQHGIQGQVNCLLEDSTFKVCDSTACTSILVAGCGFVAWGFWSRMSNSWSPAEVAGIVDVTESPKGRFDARKETSCGSCAGLRTWNASVWHVEPCVASCIFWPNNIHALISRGPPHLILAHGSRIMPQQQVSYPSEASDMTRPISFDMLVYASVRSATPHTIPTPALLCRMSRP